MYKLPAPVRRRVAASLLGVFLSAFAVQFLCLCFGVQARDLPQTAATSVADYPGAVASQSAMPPCHQPEKATAALQWQDQNTSHEHGPSDECCRDKTSAFFASLTHPPKLSLDKAMPIYLALPPANGMELSHFQTWDRTRSVVLVPPARLKPKIPDIRVFIRSLTI